jgi:hypothetical protein
MVIFHSYVSLPEGNIANYWVNKHVKLENPLNEIEWISIVMVFEWERKLRFWGIFSAMFDHTRGYNCPRIERWIITLDYPDSLVELLSLLDTSKKCVSYVQLEGTNIAIECYWHIVVDFPISYILRLWITYWSEHDSWIIYEYWRFVVK